MLKYFLTVGRWLNKATGQHLPKSDPTRLEASINLLKFQAELSGSWSYKVSEVSDYF